MAAESELSAQRSGRRWVQGVLRIGLAVGGLLLAVGVLLALVEGERRTLASSPWRTVATGALPDRLICLGMIVLAVTPAARVAVLVAVWIQQRDNRFVALALVVMTILVLSAFIAAPG